jgi:hypothetical protein
LNRTGPIRQFANVTELKKTLDVIKESNNSLSVGDPKITAFLEDLSKQLFSVSRDNSSLAPLAFFLRKSNTKSIISELSSEEQNNLYRVPLGTVFHIPPTNVDTLFLYALALSLIAGNTNVVRISPNAGPLTYELIDLMFHVFRKHQEVRNMVHFVQFERNQEYLDTISSASNLRMIWGGDSAIESIRKSPLSPNAKDLTFPDRQSFTVINASTWQNANEQVKTHLVEGLYTDSFLFDQMACSSPQQIIIVGESMISSDKVLGEVLQRLEKLAEHKYEYSVGQTINKMVSLVKVIANSSGDANWYGNGVAAVGSTNLSLSNLVRPGGGFFATQCLTSLSEIVPQLTEKIQTMSYFGFTRSELSAFVHLANGTGVDRIVPIGKALEFNKIWDGKNLIQEFTKIVTLDF